VTDSFSEIWSSEVASSAINAGKAVWVGRIQYSGGLPIRVSQLLDIPTFPLHVRDLKQGDVVFEGKAFGVIQPKITFHGLAKFLNGEIQFF
jgi:hypothetical protein